MTTLGTVQTKYRKDWIYLNPDSFNGPNAWNVANTGSDNTEGRIFAVPPMMASESNGDVDLSYSIIACKSVDELGRQLFVNDAPAIFQDTLTDIDSIEGKSPVFTNVFRNDLVIYFSIQALPSASSATAEVEGPSGYNGNSIASLTTSLPLEATEADRVATVTFDISTLEDA